MPLAPARIHPRRLSRELRETTSPELRRRRWMVGLSLVGAAIGQIVTLYQVGILKRLQTPDAALMVVTYGITAALAAAGGRDRAEEQPILPVAMAAKMAMDVGTNLKLAQEEWAENKALCAYCQTATLISLASLALSLPEAIRVLRRL